MRTLEMNCHASSPNPALTRLQPVELRKKAKNVLIGMLPSVLFTKLSKGVLLTFVHLVLISQVQYIADGENLPTAVTLAANGTNDYSCLNAIANPNGAPTITWFEWNPSAGNTNATPFIDVGNGTSNVPVSTVITGLVAGVAYQYRVVASNSFGVVSGDEFIFQLPRIVLAGANPMTNECHNRFIDPGASTVVAPLAVAGGYADSIALKYDGTVIAWGGTGNQETAVPAGLSNVVAISAGEYHTLALKNDGTVVGWGDGIFGDTTPPTGLSNIVAISAGMYYNLALRSDGTVVGWGDNSDGQTNVPPGLSNVVAIAAGNFHSLALNNEGNVIGWGNNSDGEINIPSDLTNVVAIAAYWHQSVALKEDGTLVGWGQAPLPPVLTNIVAFALGDGFGLALKPDGTVTGWGVDYFGSVSGIENLTNVIAIAAGMMHSFAVTGDGRLVVVGWDEYGQTDVPANFGGNVIESGAVDFNNPGIYTLSYAARTSSGGFGTGMRTVFVADTTPPSLTILGPNPLIMPVNTLFTDPGATAADACAGNLTSSIVVTGTVKSTELGTNILSYSVTDPSGNTTNTDRVIIVVVGAPFVSTDMGVGTNQTANLSATIDPNGGSTTAWFEWGTNALHGEATSLIPVGSGLTNVQFASSLANLTPGAFYHYRVVASNSAGCSYGRDAIFEEQPIPIKSPAIMLLGANPLTNECHNPFIDPGAFVVTPLAAISAGEDYSLALKSDGTVAAWGNAPILPLGITNVQAIAAGYLGGLALNGDGTVVGWGNNRFGETNVPAGLSNVVSISAGWGFCLALKSDGTVVGWGLGETNPPVYDGLHFGQALIPEGLDHVVAIAAGFDSSLALKSDGTVVSWGARQPWIGIYPGGYDGAIPPDNLSNVVAIAAGSDYGLALKSDGTVVGWGYNGDGQATVPNGLSNVVQIAAGFYHNLALRSDGTVVGWGDDFYGEATPPPNLENVIAISAGAYHSLALKADGTVVGWGLDPYGEADITTGGTNLVCSIPAEGFVATNDPGRYTLTYKTTNLLGVVGSVTREVIVVNTAIGCPTDVTVDFSDERGAMVHFAPKTTDLCSSFVNVNCTPRSGSWFAVGTNNVVVKATDSAGNSATCDFQVIVLGPQGIIADVIANLSVLRSNAKSRFEYRNLNTAVGILQHSLNSSLWVDQIHLDKTIGGSEFNKDYAAIEYLLNIVNENTGTISHTAVTKSIRRVVKTDYLLAFVAVEQAARMGESHRPALMRASAILAQGNEEAAASDYLFAIWCYQQAWTLATAPTPAVRP